MKTSTKLALLFAAAAPFATANLYAGELNSYTIEAKRNKYDGGYEKTEFTIGKGSYSFNDDYTFAFDVDIDTTDLETIGMDTQFVLVQGTDLQVAGFDFDMNYILRFDPTWKQGGGDDYLPTANYILQPWFSKDVSIAGKDFSLGIELWAQAGTTNTNSLQENSGFETNFYLDGSLSDNWELNLAWYNFDYYNGSDYVYTVGTEDYLTYTYPLANGFSIGVEAGLYAEYTPDADSSTYVDAYISPRIRYSSKINENATWHVMAEYEVAAYEYGDESSSASDTDWSDNEFELSVGVKFK